MSTMHLGGVLGALNHLLAAALDEAGSATAGLALESVTLGDTSCRIAGRIRSAGQSDRFLLRVDAGPPQGDRQALRLTLEQWPTRLPAPIEMLRPLLEKARLTLELDFGG